MTSTPAASAPRTPLFASKLPAVGTTIFSVMSALAAEHQAVNLGQGFPDFACDPALIDAVDQAMRAGHNQYPPMPGVPALRQAVSTKIAALHGRSYHPDSEITITAGATQGILTAILACVHPGDEVIVLDPCYDSYIPNIALAGGGQLAGEKGRTGCGCSRGRSHGAAGKTRRHRGRDARHSHGHPGLRASGR